MVSSQLKHFKGKCEKKDDLIQQKTNEIEGLNQKLQQQFNFQADQDQQDKAKIEKLEKKLSVSDEIVKRQTKNINQLVQAAQGLREKNKAHD